MNRNQPYSALQTASHLLMLLALAWLTVSLPFVYKSQRAQKEHAQEIKAPQQEEENTNPLANTTEEKTENGVNTLSEYLHEIQTAELTSSFIATTYKYHSADLYVAFHPEYICPPPDSFPA